MTNDREREPVGDAEETTSERDKTGIRGRLSRARAAASEKLEQAQEAASPGVERAREATAPQVERAQQLGAAGAERAQQVAERATGDEFRREFERYMDVATTTIVGLHQDQAALQERIAELENKVRTLMERLDPLERG